MFRNISSVVVAMCVALPAAFAQVGVQDQVSPATNAGFNGDAAFLIWHTIRLEFDSWLRVLLYLAHFATTLILAAIGFSLASLWIVAAPIRTPVNS